jgi:hypothetical protein
MTVLPCRQIAGFDPSTEALGFHVHHYNAEWDDQEREILACLPWKVTPLREVDIQYRSDETAG